MCADFTVSDVTYLEHDDGALLARLFVPNGEGPFPAVVHVHGGLWSINDRTRDVHFHESLARAGIVVVAPDFRQGQRGAYPKSVSDINYAVRWAKSRAAELKTRAEWVSLAGNSSGGHLAMLVALRPNDRRYASSEIPGSDESAKVASVAMFWPVINPSGRYRNAKRWSDRGAEWADRVLEKSLDYWGDIAAMEEGNPMLALERKEQVDLPPALWIQVTDDDIHDYHDPDSDFAGSEAHRFVNAYERAGGKARLTYYAAPAHFTHDHPTMPESVAAVKEVIDFIQAVGRRF